MLSQFFVSFLSGSRVPRRKLSIECMKFHCIPSLQQMFQCAVHISGQLGSLFGRLLSLFVYALKHITEFYLRLTDGNTKTADASPG
jgi:hypothetical protein